MNPYTFDYQRPDEDIDCRLLPAAKGCVPESGARYCTVVQAVSGHGLHSERVKSGGVKICNRPPLAGTVLDLGSPSGHEDVDHTSGHQIIAAWSGFVDGLEHGARTRLSSRRRSHTHAHTHTHTRTHAHTLTHTHTHTHTHYTRRTPRPIDRSSP